MAALGERIAASFLVRRGARIVHRNLRVGDGEIDLLVRFGTRHVAVEVRTIGPTATATDPTDRISPAKLARVWMLATRHPGPAVSRVDFVGVRLTGRGAVVTWRTGVA